LVQEILPGLFRIEVPLPKNPLKALNCYVFKGSERNLIIDTGFDREECQKALDAGLNELEIDLTKTDLFITHLHADHSGMIHRLTTPTSKIYASEADGKTIVAAAQDLTFWDSVREYSGRSGFPVTELVNAIQRHPGFHYGAKGLFNITYIHDGDKIKVGDYLLTCIATPGHTPGIMCLYEENHQLLLSSDHILGSITPNISLWSDDYNPLAEYMQSLDKIAHLEVKLTLPGHRQLFGDCKPRIAELKKHHEHRIAEVENILSTHGKMNAYQVAAHMTWDMTYKTFDEFPIPQKWFAHGEAIAHLKYLVDNGSIQQLAEGGQIYYIVNKRIIN